MQRFHVAAGTYCVSDRSPMIMQAYLGTCVGLALCCRSTGIGGIIHLLLPEPVSHSTAVHPEKYATTGIPLFIQSLLSKGARKETLVGTMAGGALMGPLSRLDLALDIGGHTAEKARALLAAYEIELVRSETGGFFTCCLELNMSTGQCAIEPAGVPKTAMRDGGIKPEIARSDIIASIDRLQPIPQVALKVLRMLDDNGHTINDIADEIRKDQVIAARTLGLANSALFAGKRPIETLDHALVYLGEDQLAKLVLNAAVQRYFEQAASGYSLCKGGLYHHAIGCAQVAEALAQKTGLVDSRIAYTAGLLHDIGKVVLDQYVVSLYPLFYRQAMLGDTSVQAVEQRLFGIDHTEVGYHLAQRWGFPASLAHCVRWHHHPNAQCQDTHLAVMVYLADVLLSRFHIGNEFERLDISQIAVHLQSINLEVERFADLVDLIPNGIFKTSPPAEAGFV